MKPALSLGHLLVLLWPLTDKRETDVDSLKQVRAGSDYVAGNLVTIEQCS